MSKSDESNSYPPADRGGSRKAILSPEVEERLKNRIADFTEALDIAKATPTPEALDRLREAADQLMRATGRVIIEIEQLRGEG